MNKENFKLIEELGEVYIEPTIKLDALNDLLTYNINQKNIYEILLIADFYQYKRMEELIVNIQLLILDKKIKIKYDKLNKEDLYNSIYINECVREGKIKCDLLIHIHNVCCVKYMMEIKRCKVDSWSIDCAAGNGYIETIKYLESQGYKGTEEAINYAAGDGHIETIKYLESKGYKGTEHAINRAAGNGHIEIIKYLESQGYTTGGYAIYMAAGNGQIETIKYLESQGYKETENAINNAARKGQLETIIYLESQGYKGTEKAINNAAFNRHIEIVKYLIEKNYKFPIHAIKYIRNKEIKDILVANKHLMV